MTEIHDQQRECDHLALNTKKEKTFLSIIIPVYNEEGVIKTFLQKMNTIFEGKTDIILEFIFINDDSRDNTLSELLEFQKNDPRIKVIDMSRRFGKEASIAAGLKAALGQIVVPIDIDLQDPPELILEMIKKWREGSEVVLGRRADRASDSWLKRFSAEWFYKIHNRIAHPGLPPNVGDFRLMDRRVVKALNQLPETRRYMKGLFAWVGFRTTYVDYSRSPRLEGQTKFSGWRLWNDALEGITSFSTAPLRIWTYIGVAVAALSFLAGIIFVIRKFLWDTNFPGYTTLMVAIFFLGGLQLIGIGIIGEYLGRTYIESKRRPVYIIRKIYSVDTTQGHT